MNLRSWIRRKPSAVALRCHTDDGTKIVRVLPDDPRKFAKAEDAITGLGAHKVEALDAENNVTRVCDLESDDPEQPDDDKPKTERESELQTFAKLLGEAYRNGATATKEQSEYAFAKLVALVEIAYQRLAGLEKAWMSTLNANARAMQRAGTGDEEEDEVLQEMMKAFMRGKAEQMGATPPAAKPNGKGTAKEGKPPKE